MKKRRSARRAFTLIEVLLVILIIGMLAAVFIGGYAGTRTGARIETTKLMMKTVENALERYNMDIGHYPTEEEGGLRALRVEPAFEDEEVAERWRAPYLKEDPKDAWNNEFHYELNDAAAVAEGQPQLKIWSSGPDGQDGTEDDIRNWSEEM